MPSARKCLKQGDVIALFALLPNAFDGRTMNASLDYYLPVTVHDSSLSWTQHALVAARRGRGELAYDCWRRCREIDMGAAPTASDGVHIANAGGLWQAMVFGFAGMDTALERENLTLSPSLPPGIESISFRVQWKGSRIAVLAARGETVIRNESHRPIQVNVAGQDQELGPSEQRVFPLAVSHPGP